MTTVILAEKPNQALAYASAFSESKREKGFFEVQDKIFTDKTFITFGYGHLVELAEPGHYKTEWEKWSLESLPIFPNSYDFVVPNDKAEQFKIVKGLLAKADTIIIATDCDREGENIAWSIINEAGAGLETGKTFKRLWINSLEPEAVRNGFKFLRNGVDYLPYYYEAQTRQIADWLIGMNASPLYSLEMQKREVKEVFSVGRVQTPTLYMIFSKHQAICNFCKEKFFEIEGLFKLDNGEQFKAGLKPVEKFTNLEEAQTFIKNGCISTPREAKVESVEANEKKQSSPKLFSLSSLQAKCNKEYKMGSMETLNTVQSLYEKKILTYPRTDTEFITQNEFSYLKNNFEKYVLFLDESYQITQGEPRKRFVNNEKVQEHHAIIPTKTIPSKETFENLNDTEKKVYLLILKTTLSMFLSDYLYSETVVDLSVGNLKFQVKGHTPLEAGWKEIFNISVEEGETALPSLNLDSKIIAEVIPIEKETTPPKKFTEGTLITAMKTAGKTVENKEEQDLLNQIEGIGTEATRAGIIETLKKKKYIEIIKNQVEITAKGILLCQAIENQNLLKSPEMTAKWESYLQKIGKGIPGASQEKFIENIQKFITHLITNVRNDLSSVNFEDYTKVIEEQEQADCIECCPECHRGQIKARKGFYGCTNYPDCKFTLGDNFRGKKLTQKNIKELILNNETVVKKVKKKDSKDTYNARIKKGAKGFYEFIEFVK